MHTSVLPPLSPLTSPPRSSVSLSSSQMPPTSSGTRVNTVILFVIVILAIVFFLSGLLHLLLRFLSKKRSSRPSPEMNRSADNIAPDSLQRQLQQLFHLHDSGLDQALIDSLPVFLYKEIMGSKEPFDCAVCLCEFSMEDSLRLLPVCSHAFHLHCIDTWLLSNSTCPLCRGLIYSDIPLFYFDESSEEHVVSVQNGDKKPVETEDTVHEKRILPVKLGKYRRLDAECGNEGETSSSSLDARRCFSMGAVQYVVGDSNLQVALEEVNHTRRDHEGITDQEDMERKKLSNVSKGDSYSVSKIWLWTKKGKASIPLDGNKNSSFNLNIPSNGGNFHV